jgi:hypothetical protein
MADADSICIRCGEHKPFALDECRGCGLQPTSSQDMAKSLILSPEFDAGENVFGRPVAELERIAARIRGGTPYEFDPAEVARVAREHDAALTITGRDLFVDGVTMFGPAVLLLAGLFWLISR